MSYPRFHLALLLCACLLGAGCAGDGPPPSNVTSTYDTIQTTIFNPRCLSAGCHNSSDRAGDLVLAAGISYGQLINVTPFNPAAQAKGYLRVIPEDPPNSFLLIKVVGPTDSAEGSRMPLQPPLLSPADIELIRSWIVEGAPGPSVPDATATPTRSATPSATPADTATSTPSATLTDTPTITATPTVTRTGTLPPTLSPTPTLPPTATPSPTATVTATASPSPMPTPTFSLASTFPQIQATIFTPTCLGLSCHNAAEHSGELVLDSDVSYANLVDVTPVNLAAAAAGMQRVDPDNAANSFLLTKITLPRVFDLQFGSRMPLGAAPLSVEQIDNIRGWILRGALADETPPAGN